jgi:phosphatidylinositol-3-phosphatase
VAVSRGFGRSGIALIVFALSMSACGASIGAAAASPTPAEAKPHIFIIVMENKSPSQALRGTYTASLAQRYALLTNYQAVAHPSLPNYLALTSGNTWGIEDDGYYQLPRGGIGDQLTAAGTSWRAYMDGMSGDCLTDEGNYSVRHNPFAYYGGRCPNNVVSLDRLAGDLVSNTPQFVWISPDMCNDTHDCPVQTGDAWLSSTVPQIISSPAWQQNGVLFIVWDESDGSEPNSVAALVIAPKLKAHTSAVAYDHYSLLATIEDRLGVSRLGNAASAKAINDVIATR